MLLLSAVVPSADIASLALPAWWQEALFKALLVLWVPAFFGDVAACGGAALCDVPLVVPLGEAPLGEERAIFSASGMKLGAPPAGTPSHMGSP